LKSQIKTFKNIEQVQAITQTISESCGHARTLQVISQTIAKHPNFTSLLQLRTHAFEVASEFALSFPNTINQMKAIFANKKELTLIHLNSIFRMEYFWKDFNKMMNKLSQKPQYLL